MKILIVSDNAEKVSVMDKALQSNGYDTIIYHWLLKALDNIEEISPDFTIVSVYDYPRHWKTLAQFEKSGICRKNGNVILYVPEDFSEDEKEKAKALGIKGTFSSVSEEGINNLLSLIGKEPANTVEVKSEAHPEEKTEVQPKTETKENKPAGRKSLLARMQEMNNVQ